VVNIASRQGMSAIAYPLLSNDQNLWMTLGEAA
jgi:hypothetical protein